MSNNEDTMKASKESSKSVWLVGASEKSQTLGAALCGLGSWGPLASGRPQELSEMLDLEELLTGQGQAGCLILDYELIPVEDIGFVRRFLERNGDWRMLVVGAEQKADCAQRLLKLARSQWLAWPPNLDEVRALLAPGTGASNTSNSAPKPAPSPAPAPVIETTAAAAPEVPAPAAASTSVDLGQLFKELLINEHLAGHKWALEFQDSLMLPIDQRLAKLSFGAFINLARACAGREGLVRAQLERSGLAGDPVDTICLQMNFPQGGLSEGDQANVLSRPIQVEGKLSSAAKAALIAAEALRKRGGRVQLHSAAAGAVQLEMHVSSADLEVLELERMEAASPTHSAAETPKTRAQDPFA